MDIIIFSGQSNMQGQSDRLSENAVVEDAYEYKFLTDEIVPLQNPVGENITYSMEKGDNVTLETNGSVWRPKHVLGAACYGHTNLVPAFCRTYIALTKREVLAVHAAKGATKISEWLPGTPGYNALVQKSRAALQKAAPERILFVWLQGESDAVARVSKDDYKKALRVLCDGLKSDVGIEKFGIIRVGRFAGDEQDEEILTAQDEMCREDADFLMLTDIAADFPPTSEYMHPKIHGHYSAEGLELLGTKAAETLAELQ